MRITVNLDDDLLAEVIRLTGEKTKSKAVSKALSEVLSDPMSRRFLRRSDADTLSDQQPA